jgi:hypothetical protein
MSHPAHEDQDTHGPPTNGLSFDRPLTDDEVRLPYDPPGIVDLQPLVERRRLITGSDRYLLLAQQLRDDPMNVIRRMLEGRYRLKRRRSGKLWVEDGQGVTEHMSMRQAADELRRITGEDVTYETLRRWWARVWPESPPPEVAVPPVVFTPPPD